MSINIPCDITISFFKNYCPRFSSEISFYISNIFCSGSSFFICFKCRFGIFPSCCFIFNSPSTPLIPNLRLPNTPNNAGRSIHRCSCVVDNFLVVHAAEIKDFP